MSDATEAVISEIETLCSNGDIGRAEVLLFNLFTKVSSLEGQDVTTMLQPVVGRLVNSLVRIGSSKASKDDLMSESYINLWKSYVPFIKAASPLVTINPVASSSGDQQLSSIPQVSIAHCYLVADQLMLKVGTGAKVADSSGSYSGPDAVESEALCSLLFFHAQRVLVHMSYLCLEEEDTTDSLDALLVACGVAMAARSVLPGASAAGRKSEETLGKLTGLLGGCGRGAALVAQRLVQVQRYGSADGRHGSFLRGATEFTLRSLAHTGSRHEGPGSNTLALPQLLCRHASVMVVTLTQLCFLCTAQELPETTVPPVLLTVGRRFVTAMMRCLGVQAHADAGAGRESEDSCLSALKAHLLCHCCGDCFALLAATADPGRHRTASPAAAPVSVASLAQHVARSLLGEILMAECAGLAVRRQQLEASQTQTAFGDFVAAQHRQVFGLVVALLRLAVPPRSYHGAVAMDGGPRSPAGRTLLHVLRLLVGMDVASVSDGGDSTITGSLVGSLEHGVLPEDRECGGDMSGECACARSRLLALLLHEALTGAVAGLKLNNSGDRAPAIDRLIALAVTARQHDTAVPPPTSTSACAAVSTARWLAESCEARGAWNDSDFGATITLTLNQTRTSGLGEGVCPSGGDSTLTHIPMLAGWGRVLANYIAGLCTVTTTNPRSLLLLTPTPTHPNRLRQALAAVRACHTIATGLADVYSRSRTGAVALATEAAGHLVSFACALSSAARRAATGLTSSGNGDGPTVGCISQMAARGVVLCILESCQPLLLSALRLCGSAVGAQLMKVRCAGLAHICSIL